MRTFFILLSSALTTASLVHAANDVGTAQLGVVSGTVLVNTGKGFVAAAPDQSISLKPGDKILLKQDSLATVSYADCAITIAEPTLFTVSETAPCSKGASLPAQSYMITPTQDSGPVGDPLLPFVKTAIVAGMLGGSAYVLIDGLTDDENDGASAE